MLRFTLERTEVDHSLYNASVIVRQRRFVCWDGGSLVDSIENNLKLNTKHCYPLLTYFVPSKILIIYVKIFLRHKCYKATVDVLSFLTFSSKYFWHLKLYFQTTDCIPIYPFSFGVQQLLQYVCIYVYNNDAFNSKMSDTLCLALHSFPHQSPLRTLSPGNGSSKFNMYQTSYWLVC